MTKPKPVPRQRGDGDIIARPSGHHQARWYEPQPNGTTKRRSRTFPTKEAAEKHLQGLSRARQDGAYIPPSDQTIADLVASWLERGRARWKPATLAAYRQRADTHVLPAFGKLRADSLTTPRVQHWIDQLARAGFDASTIDCVHRILSATLREAVQIGILTRNPAEGVRRPPVRVKEAATWSGEEVARIMRATADHPFWHAVYRIALATGMRPGELRGLQWADVNVAECVITVRRTISKDADGHVAIGATTKTGRSRQIAITPAAMRVLTVWRTVQKERRIACADWHDDDLIFDRGDGRFLPLTTWQHAHKRFSDAAGVKTITLHQLRHSHATLELEAGTHPLIVSRRLGHSGIQTTLDRYSHVSLDLQRAAADAFDARLFGDEAAKNG